MIHKIKYLELYISTLTESSSGLLRYRSNISYLYNALNLGSLPKRAWEWFSKSRNV